MSQMPDAAKKSEHILSEVRRMLEENGVLESRSPMAVLQSQFDAAIAQRDELIGDVERLSSEIARMMQVIESSPRLVADLRAVHEAEFQAALNPIAKRIPSSHQSAINDICHFIRSNRDRFWDEHGECEPHFLPPMGYVKSLDYGTFFLFTSQAFLQATKACGRIMALNVLLGEGVLLTTPSHHYKCKKWVRAIGASDYYYAVNAKIFEFESR